jgi:hypothetical protein
MTGLLLFCGMFFGSLISELLSELLFLGTILFTGYQDFLEEGHNLYTPPFTPFPLLLWFVPPLPSQSVNSL